VGEAAHDADGDEHPVLGHERGGERGEPEHGEHADEEAVPRHPAGEGRERRRRDDDGEREDRHEQPDERLGDAEALAHLGQQAGGQHLDGDGQEDARGQHEEAGPGQSGCAHARGFGDGHEDVSPTAFPAAGAFTARVDYALVCAPRAVR
jgi:hypothetical protein